MFPSDQFINKKRYHQLLCGETVKLHARTRSKLFRPSPTYTKVPIGLVLALHRTPLPAHYAYAQLFRINQMRRI